jgi:hypothetical protein
MASRYNEDFEPLLIEGMTATLQGARQAPNGLNVECIAVNAMPEYLHDFGALTAATWSNDNEDTNLEMGKWELVQLRMRVLDDIQVKLKNPSSVSQWRTNRTAFYLPQFPTGVGEDFLKHWFWKASEIFIFEDEDTPRFDLYSALGAIKSRILFSGWRFKLRNIAAPGRISVWINAWPAASGSGR